MKTSQNPQSSLEIAVSPVVANSGDVNYLGKFSTVWPATILETIRNAGATPLLLSYGQKTTGTEADAYQFLPSDFDVANITFQANLHKPIQESIVREAELQKQAIASGKPVMAVCGAMHNFMHLTLGIPMRPYISLTSEGGVTNHHKHGFLPTQAAHAITIHDPDSMLGKVAAKLGDGNIISVNSAHKQGIHRDDFMQCFGAYTAKDDSNPMPFYISLVATSDDGIVEASEIRAKGNNRLIAALYQFQPQITSLTTSGVADNSKWEKTAGLIYKEFALEVERAKHLTSQSCTKWKDTGKALLSLINERSVVNQVAKMETKPLAAPFDFYSNMKMPEQNAAVASCKNTDSGSKFRGLAQQKPITPSEITSPNISPEGVKKQASFAAALQ